MNSKMQKLARAAFQQGIEDENCGRYDSARLRINEKVRDFYDAARKQRAEQLRPEREGKAAEEATIAKRHQEEVTARIIKARPAIQEQLDKNNPLGAIRLVLNAQLGI